MGYHPLVDSAIQPIKISHTFCIYKTVPGFLDVIPFQLLDVVIFVVQQLNDLNNQNFRRTYKTKLRHIFDMIFWYCLSQKNFEWNFQLWFTVWFGMRHGKEKIHLYCKIGGTRWAFLTLVQYISYGQIFPVHGIGFFKTQVENRAV